MKIELMRKNVGTYLRIRPIATRIHQGTVLPREDDDWIVDSVEQVGIKLRNTRTAHLLTLGYDQVHSFTSDPMRDVDGKRHGFLQLRVKVTLKAEGLRVEPLAPGKWGEEEEARAPSKVEIRKVKDGTPKYLVRLSTGKELLDMLTGNQSYQFDHDEAKSESDAELIGGFLQLCQDWGEISDDIPVGDRPKRALQLNTELESLKAKGFGVFAAKEKRVLTVDGKASDDWSNLILQVKEISNGNQS